MKSFLIRIGIFFAIVAVVDYSLGEVFHFLQSTAGGRTGAEYYVCENAMEDVIIMGSSRASHHYVPEIISDHLGMSCFNAGQDGNGIVLQYGRWKLLSKRYAPKMIIYDINVSFDLAQNDNLTYIDRLKPFCSDDSIKKYVASLFPIEQIKLYSKSYRYNYKFLEMLIDCIRKSDYLAFSGYIPLFGHIRKEVVARKSIVKTDSIQLDSIKLFYLEQLIQEAKEAGTDVVLSISPSWDGGRYSQSAYFAVKEIANKYNVRFYDFCDSELCDNPDFFEDSAHLNDKGARAFTEEFVKRLLSCEAKERSVLFHNANESYVIRDEIDLMGSCVYIPKGCSLFFDEKGVIKNGTLVGDATIINADSSCSSILQNVVIQGEWNVPIIYSKWLDFEEGRNNTRQIKSLFALCSPDVDNTVIISSGIFWLDSYDKEKNTPGVIYIPSNTHVKNEAIFKALPSDMTQSFLFYFRGVSNCIWEGGSIVGDLETHENDKGEQGFGIAIRGARNIVLRNVICQDCFGDGINLQYGGQYGHNENILIEGVFCVRNRRQGLSIEDGINITVKNSCFAETGSMRGHAPMNAIDIEPSYKEAIIRNITIEDCRFANNKGGGLNCSYLKSGDGPVFVNNVDDINGRLRFNDCLSRTGDPGILITGYRCETGKLHFKRKVQNLKIENSCFMSCLNETSHKDTLSNVVINNVVFKTSEPRTWNFYCLALVCAKMQDVDFNRCTFEVMDGSGLTSVISSGGDWTGAQLRQCKIIEHRNNRMYIPCDVIGSQIECSAELTFVCCKEIESLYFQNNEVLIHRRLRNSPFVFRNSSNPSYDITGNVIMCDGAFSNNSVLERLKTNKSISVINFENNRFLNKK